MKVQKQRQAKKIIVRRRHRLVFALLHIILWPFFALRYRYHYEKYRLRKDGHGPFLILGNHSNMLDPIFLSFSFDMPIYFISSEQIFNLGWVSKVLRFLVRPISKTKSMADIGTIKEVKRCINEGGSVGMFVEGNTSYTGENPSTPKAIGKLIKHLNVPVIFYTLHGLYLSYPRWAFFRKKGKSYGKIKRILFPAEYSILTEEEIYEIVVKELYVNAYIDQAKTGYLYKGKNRAEGLERILFACPVCHSVGSLTTKEHDITCQKCNAKATYLESGRFKSDQIPFETIIEWDAYQKEELVRYLHEFSNGVIFESKGVLWNSDARPKKRIGAVRFAIDPNGILIESTNQKLQYEYDRIHQLSIQGRHKIILYLTSGDTWLLDFKGSVNPYLYLLTFQYYKMKKRGFENENINGKLLGL